MSALPRALPRGVGAALLAAALFGASTPFAKLLLREVDPWLLAGVLYLGSGLGLLGLVAILRRARGARAEAPLQGQDWIWLGLAIAAGGGGGPVLLMLGLSRTAATTAALLLNLEGVFTALLAWRVFRENVDRRIALGMAAIVVGGIVLTGGTLAPSGGIAGPLAIVAACLAWAIDNNLTRRIASADPLRIAMLKGCAAGVVNVGIALSLGAAWPASVPLAAGALLGLGGYGISLVLFVVALRHVGAARTGAYFSLAPFFGAALGVALLREPITGALILAGVLMGWGVWLHVTEEHSHEHAHHATAHAHRHVHDEHHQHVHEDAAPPGEPHSHWHVHEPLRHRHPHYPDIHHRHDHPG